MKTTVAILIAAIAISVTGCAATPAPVSYEPTPEPVRPQTEENIKWETCNKFGKLAHNVMEGYQLGVPYGNAMRIALDIPEEALKKMVVEMVKYAYSTPRYLGSSMRYEATVDFENLNTRACMEGLGL